MADFEVCKASTLPDDLAAQIKSGHLADAVQLFKDCIPLTAINESNAMQKGDGTKNQIRSMQDAAKTEFRTMIADSINDKVAEKLGLKSGQKTGLETVIADLDK
jgi:hypothetical protein